MTPRRRLRRWVGLVGLAGRRVVGRLRHSDRSRLVLSIGGVTLAIAFLVVVTSISLGLASQATIHGQGVDYWVTPESASASTMPVSVGGPSLGAVHSATDRIERIDGVRYATPVAVEVLELQRGQSTGYVVVLGVIASPGGAVAGLPMSPLTPGDPMYENGTYEGPRTGEIVLSEAASEVLNASRSDAVRVQRAASGNDTFRVVNVSAGTLSTGSGTVPVGLVHLAELQSVTSDPPRDTADQILVSTNARGVKSEIAGVYPSSNVVSGSGFSTQSFTESDLALAVALSAFLVALVVGVLFTATTLGLDVAADRPQYATLSAIGFSTASRTVVVTAQTLVVVGVGGLFGIALGAGGSVFANSILEARLGVSPALLHPLLVPYGVGVSLVIGLLAVPYLVWLTNSTDTLAQLNP